MLATKTHLIQIRSGPICIKPCLPTHLSLSLSPVHGGQNWQLFFLLYSPSFTSRLLFFIIVIFVPLSHPFTLFLYFPLSSFSDQIYRLSPQSFAYVWMYEWLHMCMPESRGKWSDSIVHILILSLCRTIQDVFVWHPHKNSRGGGDVGNDEAIDRLPQGGRCARTKSDNFNPR